MKFKQYLNEGMMDKKKPSIGDLQKSLKLTRSNLKDYKSWLKRNPKEKKGLITKYNKKVERANKWIAKYEDQIEKLRKK